MTKPRKYDRKQANAFLGVFDRITDKYIGKLIDMTVKGLKLNSVEPFEADKLYEFMMYLPIAFEGDKQITFKCQCVWCAKSDDGETYNVGFQLKKVHEKEITKINQLLGSSLFYDASEKVQVTISSLSE